MKYTIDNYEEFAIDYLEGNLNRRDRQEFEAFLMVHPELKETFDDFNLVHLPNFQTELPSKEKLYRKEVKVISVFNYFRAIAAAIVLLLIFGLFIQKGLNKGKDQIVMIDKAIDPELTETPLQVDPSPQLKKEETEEKPTSLLVAEAPPKPRIKNSAVLDKKENRFSGSKRTNAKKENTTNDLALDFSSSKATEKTETQRLQTVVFIENIKIIPAVEIYYQIENRPTYLFLEPEKKEDTVSKIGKLLAKANLIPTGLREEITESNFREKVIPESYMDFK